MLDIKEITFSYHRGVQVLDNFSLSISDGGIYGLLGRNGAGKSTLLYLISGLLTPSYGYVEFNGQNTRRRLPTTLEDIFIVPEEFSLPGIPLDRYVSLYAPMYPRFDHSQMNAYLDMFGMSHDLNLGALSMGQKKKVFMSFALACNTSLLLMDEPSNGLDIPGKSAFRRAISAAASENRIIIISTHQVRDIDHILDHIIVMDNQRVILNATVNEIQDRFVFRTTSDQSAIANALYAMPNLEGTAVIERNDGTHFTEMNLETLFLYALSNPASISGIMTSGTTETNDDMPSIPPYPPFNTDNHEQH